MMPAATDIDSYIAQFPKPVQDKLRELREAIQKAAPAATEGIKYAMPTFMLHGNLVHFAAFSNHIGFYPAPQGITEFEKELSPYKSGKGSVQFPLDQPVPLKLVTKIVKFRVAQHLDKVKAKEAMRAAGKKERVRP
jgi:uncharacterized protein YdhG (YjbR/CyaY superfamily)